MKKKLKPHGWPDYMQAKPSKGGVTRYYWSAPTWARKRSYSITSEPLGTDYAAAKARCDSFLNPAFDSWRTSGASDEKVHHKVVIGSFDWAVATYRASKKFTKRPARTRASYDRALNEVAGYLLTNGRRFGSLSVKAITSTAVDLLYDKIKIGKDGKPRQRSALLAMTVCKIAWGVAARVHPTVMPAGNPFKGIEIEYDPKKNRSATLDELGIFVTAADADGSPSLGTAAMIAFYWLPREEDIFERFAWSDYRPTEMPDHVQIWHHKNRKTEKVASPAVRCGRNRALARDGGAHGRAQAHRHLSSNARHDRSAEESSYAVDDRRPQRDAVRAIRGAAHLSGRCSA